MRNKVKTHRLKAVVVLSILQLATFAPLAAQVSVKPYGFVRNYLNFDSRKTYTVVGGEYNMIPYDELWNTDQSCDLRAVPHMQLQALTTRIGLRLTGPEIFGYLSSGVIEGDFGGFGSNNTVFRIRQAYVKLHSTETRSSAEGESRRYYELLVGQTWHPLSGEIMPDVLGMAAGAPFRPHSRTPQLRAITYYGSFGFTAALLYQLQYMNNGPKTATDATSTASTDYALNALWPEAFLGLNFKQGPWYLQLGFDAQIIRPRTHAMGSDSVVREVSERVKSFTPTLYAQYDEALFSVKFRTMLAQNTSHLNQLVGYGVTAEQSDGSWDYAPLRSTISYLNISYGKKYRLNLFLGYAKNLGAAEKLHDFGADGYRIYTKGGNDFTHLDDIWRVCPGVSYNIKAFSLGIEYEVTGVHYGDLDAYGAVLDNNNRRSVLNHRICALVKYSF